MYELCSDYLLAPEKICVTDGMFSLYYKNVTCYNNWKSKKKKKNQTCITKKICTSP